MLSNGSLASASDWFGRNVTEIDVTLNNAKETEIRCNVRLLLRHTALVATTVWM